MINLYVSVKQLNKLLIQFWLKFKFLRLIFHFKAKIEKISRIEPGSRPYPYLPKLK